MADDGENASRSEKDEIRRHAKRWVQHVRRDVLTTPARRAAVRAAFGKEPGRRVPSWRSAKSIRLPSRVVEARRRTAFLTVAAMMCARTAASEGTGHRCRASQPHTRGDKGHRRAEQGGSRVRGFRQRVDHVETRVLGRQLC